MEPNRPACCHQGWRGREETSRKRWPKTACPQDELREVLPRASFIRKAIPHPDFREDIAGFGAVPLNFPPKIGRDDPDCLGAF